MSESVYELRHRLTPQVPVPAPPPVRSAPPSPAFAVEHPQTGTVLVAVPAEVAAAPQAEDFLLRLSGRLVEAEAANANGAFWSYEDLEFGVATVAHGPVNWLHQERKVIGTLTDARLVDADNDEREAAKAAFVSAEARRKMAGRGVAMPDGGFPIPDESHLRSAIRLAHTPAQRRHVIRRARALGKVDLIPENWTREKAAVALGPHIEADSVLWRWLYPEETHQIEQAAESSGLWYSMECISRQVACVGERGCGAVCSYQDMLSRSERACAHVRERSAARRLVDPIFQGVGMIIPPSVPGWAAAEVTVTRQAAALVENHEITMPGLDTAAAEAMVAQILTYAAAPSRP